MLVTVIPLIYIERLHDSRMHLIPLEYKYFFHPFFLSSLVDYLSLIVGNKMSSYDTYYIKEETNYTNSLLALLQENLGKNCLYSN